MSFRKTILAALLLAPLAACDDGCGNEVVSRVDAPGGQLSAVMFQRDCGATTGFTTQVSILRPGEVPAGKGNVFIADDNHGAAKVGPWDGPWADPQWLAPDHLRIRYAAKARVVLRQESMAGVRVTYQLANE